jgi:chromosome partitioning protein
VLVVDLDPQGNATSGFGIDRSRLDGTLYEVLLEERDLDSVIIATAVEGCAIAPASVALAGAEIELATAPQRERRVKRALAGVTERFDYLVIDCPPSLGLLTVNALTAATSVLIPTQCEYYALEGLSQLIATLNLVRDNLNPTLAIKGVVLTMFDARTNLSSDVASEVRGHFGHAVFDTIIPRSVRLSEAPSFGLPIALYRADSRGAEAYDALAAELLRRDVREPATPGTPETTRATDPVAIREPWQAAAVTAQTPATEPAAIGARS